MAVALPAVVPAVVVPPPALSGYEPAATAGVLPATLVVPSPPAATAPVSPPLSPTLALPRVEAPPVATEVGMGAPFVATRGALSPPAAVEAFSVMPDEPEVPKPADPKP